MLRQYVASLVHFPQRKYFPPSPSSGLIHGGDHSGERVAELVVVVFSAVFVDSTSSLRRSSSLELSSLACSVNVIEVEGPKLQNSS